MSVFLLCVSVDWGVQIGRIRKERGREKNEEKQQKTGKKKDGKSNQLH